jgi:hypothetical protein
VHLANINDSQSSHLLSLNTSLHRSLSETDTHFLDQIGKFKSKQIQQYRKPFVKSLTIIPLTRKGLYYERTYQTNEKSKNLQKVIFFFSLIKKKQRIFFPFVSRKRLQSTKETFLTKISLVMCSLLFLIHLFHHHRQK